MAIFTDIFEDWKKASPKQKLIIAGVGIAALALAFYLHKQSTGGSSTQGTGTAGLPAGFTPGTGGVGGTGTTSTPVQGSPIVSPTDGGSNPTPPPYTGTGTNYPVPPPYQGSGTVPTGTHPTQTPSPVSYAYFGRTQHQQPSHKGYSPPKPPAPPTYPTGFGSGYAPRRSQPTATAQVYAGIHHAKAV